MTLKEYLRKTIRCHLPSSDDRFERIAEWLGSHDIGLEFYQCENCQAWENTDELTEVHDHRGFTRNVCSNCRDENYFCCDDEEEDEDEIPEYHSHTRTHYDGKEMRFGIELELKAHEGEATTLRQVAEDAGFIAERDGSLDDERGVEIVGPPLTFAENTRRWCDLLDKLRGHAVGWDAGTGYGMHVSINRNALSTYHQGKILVFIHGNKGLCEEIAGRKEVHWAAYHEKRLAEAKRTSGDKYEAAALRGCDRIEVRIFRSTLKPEGFLRNLEFCASVVEFTRDAGIRELDDITFRAWLGEPRIRKAYPNLWAHLFPGKAAQLKQRRVVRGLPPGTASDPEGVEEEVPTPALPLAFPAPPEGRSWHNPENLTPEQVGVADGWRLVLSDEPTTFPHQHGYPCWVDSTMCSCCFIGLGLTYRTREPLPTAR